MSSVSPQRSVALAAFSLLLTRLAHCSASARDTPTIAGYFGTKGRYEEVNPHLLRDILAVNRSVLRAPESERCRPVFLSAVIRHGSRYPTVKNIRRIRRLYELVRAEAASPAAWLEEIRSGWDMWYTDDMDGQLVEKGRSDLRNLARRLAALLPSLLSEENLRRRRIRFLSSSKHRCLASMEAFQEGLHLHWGATDVGFQHVVNDELMRFFERCRGYVDGVENNRSALVEVEKFKGGEEMEAVRRRMAERLGLPPHRLTPDLVEAAFFLCSYEFSIRSLNSPWCFLFDENDAKVLEYKSDLKQFWKRAHGHQINSRSSCALLQDVFRELQAAGARSDGPGSASIQLGHAETLLPLLALLGLYRDPAPPAAHNYHTQHGRSFRTSRIVPYAANLLFVLYDCRPAARLQLLLNESPVRFPGLQEDAPLLRDVLAAYRHLLDGCDVDKECEVKPGHRPNNEL
ncbi:multiple inositol polyphosphate phosphatase 1b isoform X2 [Myripristis murdjan]|uniref:multiple inositol polyphosphate phosphatase 1b isoform X2 n=1 Tax=Myripristis murdjan TaxID=586833 RepID=UPI001175D2D7|nr:multiple inositol polyphosphate phosphatase 1-like isoform X2 [Myripristis murdjan]